MRIARARRGTALRNGEAEVCPLPRLGLDPGEPSVALDNALAERQAYAGSKIAPAGVQPLKDVEDAVEILRLNPDAIVPDGEKPILLPFLDANMDFWRPFTSELNRVADEVLKHLRHLGGINAQSGKGLVRDPRARFV